MDKYVDILKKINFGEIDGYGDENLESYFLDNDYWDNIINKKIFFVIGKKGTGKSSIYRMIKQQSEIRGDIISNNDFGSFPFAKLLQLSDDDFAKPNQYQSIWKYVILNIFAGMINQAPNINNEYADAISEYIRKCVGENVVDLHTNIVKNTSKTNIGLSYKTANLGREYSVEKEIGNGIYNITEINKKLYELILNFFKTNQSDTKFIIQFDRLDDNYNQYQDVEEFYQAIISLFKVVYYINQEFSMCQIKNAKIVVYLRSDIYRELNSRDAESARWQDYSKEISWAIINSDDWYGRPKLLQMIDKRIEVSLGSKGIDMNFREIFDNNRICLVNYRGRLQDVFKYIVTDTMHRPRDIIKFCKCIQEEAQESELLYYKTIKNAEKKYTAWLVRDELANEINPILKGAESVYELIRRIGSKPFSLSDFNDRYKTVDGLNLSNEELASFLYDIGILQNVAFVRKGNGQIRRDYRSIIRNSGGWDRNMKMIVHPGVWKGLNT